MGIRDVDGGAAGVAFAPRRLAHGTFFVSDLAASTDFYTNVCGLDLVFEEPGLAANFFSNGNTHHDVALVETTREERLGRDGQVQVHKGRGSRPGLNHLGFELNTEADLVAAYQRATAAGVPIHRTADHQVARSVYLFDPEGNYLEFYADSTRQWRDVFDAAGSALITGTWDPAAEPASTEQRFDPRPDIVEVPGAPVHPVRSAHATLAVRDLERAVGFYTDTVGLSVARISDDLVVLCGRLGAENLTLIRAEAGLTPGFYSFGLELADRAELSTARDRLGSAGLQVHSLRRDTREGLVIHDPDGLRLEFYVMRTAARPAS